MELKTYFAQDAAGNIISSAIVNVFLHGTTTLATGLTRADGTPLENPFAADGAGRIQFRAPDGYYDVQVSAGPGIIQTLTIQCVDYSEAKADADRAEEAADRADVSAEQAQNALNSITGINANFEQNSREQWRRSLAEAGLTLVSGSFEEGATVNSKTDAVWHISGGQCYAWDGELPKDIPARSNPVGDANWKPQTDQGLRNDLASLSGASLLGGGLYSDIRAYSGDNSVILCKGAFAINDGGAGVFRLDASGSVAIDDGGYRLIDANGRMWVRDVADCVLFNWWAPDTTGATDSLAKLTAAASVAALLLKPLILPAGVIGITDEFVPPNGLDMRGYGNSLRAGNRFATTIKWIGGVAVKKAVIRCSRSPIGVTPTEDVSAVRITNIIADCDNKATNGFYFRYFTNESHCDNITAINARVVGISVYQSWFCSFGTIVAHDNYGSGVVIGYPTQGETDDLAVNSVSFLRIRTHTNGRNGDFDPSPDSATRYSGAGLITRSSGCTYSNIQSEKNFGFGWIEMSPRSSNEFGSYYTEFNGVSDGSNGYGFLSPDDIGGYKSTYINSVTLYSREQFINEAETPVCIGNFTKAVDAFNSVFSGVGGFRIMGGEFYCCDRVSVSIKLC